MVQNNDIQYGEQNITKNGKNTKTKFNNVNVSGQNWGSPPNGVGNMRVFCVLEHGGIAAGSLIHTTITQSDGGLPVSCQNNNSYCVVEYDI